MAMSFLYLAIVRMLKLLRLQRRDAADLAIEIIVLRVWSENSIAVTQPSGTRE
jgi:hypothetical protein